MKVLLVDDSKTMRMIVQRTLRQAGFTHFKFIEAANGVEGLAMVNAESPELILSDWNMPEMTGIEFLQNVRAQGIGTTFGFVTSERSGAIQAEALTAGASFLITKPFTPESVQQALEPVLGACR
jgi:two-component system, chemotaxis family, chemotaxis protein CheY